LGALAATLAAMDFPEALSSALKAARHVAVLTGAGMSAESGVPTFRDALTGMWAAFNPEDLATPEAFMRDPKMVSDWYKWRRELVESVAPNPGHFALAELAKRFEHFTLTTQNIDGLHAKAGSENVLELHGNIMRAKCFDTGKLWDGPMPGGSPPLHPETGGMLRPDVVWFGEMLPEDALMQSFQAARDCDVYLTIGTSAVVYPAAALPYQALEAGVTVIEINPEETAFTPHATFSLRGKSGEVLPALLEALN
jgi:NAD-dependent deacetylase